MTSIHKNTLLLLPALLLMQWSYGQYDIPEKPDFIPPVIDSTKTLSKVEYDNLYEKLKNYSDTTSTEMMIVIIESVRGENIGLLAPRWGHKWEIGKAEEDNGVFILVAKNDRKLWIAPGYGVEERLTAGINGTIIRNVIIPEFKRGDYYAGLDKGSSAIMEVLAGVYTNDADDDSRGFPSGVIAILIIIFVIIIIIISGIKNNGGGGGRRRRGLNLTDILILSSLGKGSFGSGSSFGSGGSFGGFGGGGGFSGGGAGGSW